MKYYFVSSMYRYAGYQEFTPQSEVTEGQHPFEIIAEYSKTIKGEIVLLSWQEITKEEYDLFCKLDNGE